MTVEVSDETLREWLEALTLLMSNVPPAEAERVGSMVTVLTQWSREQQPDGLSSPVGDSASPFAARTTRELSTLAAALTDSITPGVAERVTVLLTELSEAGSRLASPAGMALVESVVQEAPDLVRALHLLAEWQVNGTWEVFEGAVNLLKSLHDSLNPALVERIVGLLGDLLQTLNQAVSTGMLDSAVRLVDVATESLVQAQDDHRRLTVMGLLREVQNPEVQVGVKTLLQMLRKVPYVIRG